MKSQPHRWKKPCGEIQILDDDPVDSLGRGHKAPRERFEEVEIYRDLPWFINLWVVKEMKKEIKRRRQK